MDQTLYTPFPETHRQPPDYLITYVISEANGDVHAFVPENLALDLVKEIADNFSRRVQQQVKVFYDGYRKKFRLCPLPENATADTNGYGVLVFSCDQSDPKHTRSAPDEPQMLPETQVDGEHEKHIPRPCNSWILFRRLKSREISESTPGLTAGRKSSMISEMWAKAPAEEKEFWQNRAKEEDRIHKEMYPDYKFTTKKSSSKKRKASLELPRSDLANDR